MKTAQELFGITHPGQRWEDISASHAQAWQNWADRISHNRTSRIQVSEELNQAMALIMLGYRLRMNMSLLLDPQLLGEDWGGPPPSDITNPIFGGIVINLDSDYHDRQNPVFETDDLTVDLGFNGAVTCLIPWRAIQRVIFNPVMPAGPDAA